MSKETETTVSAHPVAQTREEIPLPEPSAQTDKNGDPIIHARTTLQRWRENAIRVTPAFIVNNATNFIGFTQLLAEALMFKSAGVVFMKNNRGGTAPNIFIDPLYNIGRTFFNRDKALNSWQAQATSVGTATFTINALTPEKKDDDQSIDESLRQRLQSPTRFYANQFRHGFYLFNSKYKREQVGMGVTVAGVLSALSGFTNVDRNIPPGFRAYLANKNFVNPAHTVGGLITAVAGSLLWFAPTAEQGWKRFGTTMWLRFTTLPFAIRNKREKNDLWGYYTGGQALLLSSSTAAFLVGGAEKRADGTIVDHTETRRKAREKYGRHHHTAASHGHHQTPVTTVSAVSEHQGSVTHREADNAAIR